MKRILLYISILSVVSITGCKKFLEQEPDNRTNVTTPQQVTQLLTSAYPHGNYILFCESMSDNVEDKGNSSDAAILDPSTNRINTESFRFEDVQSKDEDSPEAYWDSCYKAISAANQALETINNAPNQADFTAQKGEALLARAYAHFMLVTLFSKAYDPATAASDLGIPYVTVPEKVAFAQYDRKTVKYVYDMIEKDLTEGLPLISDKIYDNAPKFHFNTKAAHAFATRFYLFKQDYAQVVAHANQAVTGLIADNLRPWNGSYSNMQPVELRLIYSNPSERANILLQECNSLWGRSFAYLRYSMYNNIQSSVMNGPNPTGGQFAIGYKVYGAQPIYYNVPKFYENFVYASATANFGEAYNTIPLLTSEEVIFNRAEANIRLKNYADALVDLNAWASKNIRTSSTNTAYNPVTHNLTTQKITAFYNKSLDSSMLLTVLDFKRVFFIHEGMRWFDILRLKLPVVHVSEGKVYALAADDKRKILQIPSDATLAGIPLNPR